MQELCKALLYLKKRPFLVFLFFSIVLCGATYGAIDEIFVTGVLRNATNNSLIDDTFNIFINITNTSDSSLVYSQTQSSISVDDGIYHVIFNTITNPRWFLSGVNFTLKIGSTVFPSKEVVPVPVAHAAFVANDSDYLGGLPASDYITSTSDSNASTACNDGEYLDGSGVCIGFNSTTNSSIDNRVTLSFLQSILNAVYPLSSSLPNLTRQDINDSVGNLTQWLDTYPNVDTDSTDDLDLTTFANGSIIRNQNTSWITDNAYDTPAELYTAAPHTNRSNADIISVIQATNPYTDANLTSDYPNLDTDSTNDLINGSDANFRLLTVLNLSITGRYLATTLGFNLTDDGSNLILTTDVAGNNYFEIGTDGSFMEIYSNPNVANGYKMVTFTETQGENTFVNIYEGGTGHNRLWDSGSMRVGGSENYLCSELTTDVDCDTSATGADLVVQDDTWTGGKFISNSTDGWENVSITESQISDLSHTSTTGLDIVNQTILNTAMLSNRSLIQLGAYTFTNYTAHRNSIGFYTFTNFTANYNTMGFYTQTNFSSDRNTFNLISNNSNAILGNISFNTEAGVSTQYITFNSSCLRFRANGTAFDLCA